LCGGDAILFDARVVIANKNWVAFSKERRMTDIAKSLRSMQHVQKTLEKRFLALQDQKLLGMHKKK